MLSYWWRTESVGERKGLKLLAEEQKPFNETCRYFCLAKPTKYDVIFSGRKVGGAAQRRTKEGFLHQGSITLGMVSRNFLEDVLEDKEVIDAMTRNSCALLSEDETIGQLQDAKRLMHQLFEGCCQEY